MSDIILIFCSNLLHGYSISTNKSLDILARLIKHESNCSFWFKSSIILFVNLILEIIFTSPLKIWIIWIFWYDLGIEMQSNITLSCNDSPLFFCSIVSNSVLKWFYNLSSNLRKGPKVIVSKIIWWYFLTTALSMNSSCFILIYLNWSWIYFIVLSTLFLIFL